MSCTIICGCTRLHGHRWVNRDVVLLGNDLVLLNASQVELDRRDAVRAKHVQLGAIAGNAGTGRNDLEEVSDASKGSTAQHSTGA